MGGEREIYLPKTMLNRFIEDEDWAWKTMNKFSRIVYLADPSVNVPILDSEKHKDRIGPKDWE